MNVKIWGRLALVTGLLLYGVSSAQAATNTNTGGISLGGTRLIFDGSKDASSMTVSNSSDNDVWLMRFWISPYDSQSDNADKKQSMPFVVTPPLYRLDIKSAVQLRINKIKDDLPTDKESVFYLNNLAIPPKPKTKGYQKALQSGLQFAVNTRIKLFYRPAAISNAAAVKAAPDKLTVSATGKDLVVQNPTPYYITLTQLLVNGKAIETDKDTMVAPKGQLFLPSLAKHGTLSYSTVDDRGMTTAKLEKSF
ncbi:molecular chaperone [Enterobacteriaceae bacterium LUAb1]